MKNNETLISGNPILVVDDNENNRTVLRRGLSQMGLEVMEAENGRIAMDMILESEFDLILLDIMMPEMNGFQVLEKLNEDPKLKMIPVIVVSAAKDIEAVVKCIELGADDYLTKPFNKTVLLARVSVSLEKKRLYDKEKTYLAQIEYERERAEKLIANMLPPSVADRLKNNEKTIADNYADASVLFADIVGFTAISTQISPIDLVSMLDEIFFQLDEITYAFGLEKIKTIGDAYMVAGGLPDPRPDHLELMADLALKMPEVLKPFSVGETPLEMRMGLHCGTVVAGVIGRQKFIYDIWGDTVNVASRFSDLSIPGQVLVTGVVNQRLQDKFVIENRGIVDVKGRGDMDSYVLKGRK